MTSLLSLEQLGPNSGSFYQAVGASSGTVQAALAVGTPQWYEQMRIVLIGQVHELIDIAERHAWTKDPEEKRRTEGAIAYARKVTAPYNYNGGAS